MSEQVEERQSSSNVDLLLEILRSSTFALGVGLVIGFWLTNSAWVEAFASLDKLPVVCQ